MGFHRNFRTTTAEAWHIKAGKTAYVEGASGAGTYTGTAYTPAMMQFNGSSGYYSNTSYTSSGNKVSAIIRFKIPDFAGGSAQYLFRCDGPSGNIRLGVFVIANDHATANFRRKVQMLVQNSAGTVVARLISASVAIDDVVHLLQCAYDGDIGAGVLYIDGANEDDTGNGSRTAPTTGSLGSGPASRLLVGAGTSGPSLLLNGQLGFLGHHEAYLTNHGDFMRDDGSPIAQPETGTWGGFGSQPKIWHEAAKLDENTGGIGALTKNGTITLGKGGNT